MNYLGLSQQEFASRLNMNPASISNIFNGRSKATINHVGAIHNYFPQFSTDWIIFGAGEMLVSADANNAPFSTPITPLVDDGDDDVLGDLFGGTQNDGMNLDSSRARENVNNATSQGSGVTMMGAGGPQGVPGVTTVRGQGAATRMSGGGVQAGGNLNPNAGNSGPQSGVSGMQLNVQKQSVGGHGQRTQQRSNEGLVENYNYIDKTLRRVKEIRVFYDDNTYETFVPAVK